ncbi:MAG: S-layer homology domain-containing protein, partial [Clostridiales bacterium]|nr:S-layer homology domain-containing protein [Clostridiales bacterium]
MEMKNIRKAAAAVLTAALLTASVFAEGLTFIDVPEDEWYYADVEKAVSSGLISGKSEEIYAPDDFLTLAETVKLAACMNELYTAGAVTLAPGDPWYAPYVAYASENGIIDSDDGYSWNETASRAEFAEIFARALPDEALAAINAVADESIPDVGDETAGKDAIYSLYRAGVLTGSDDQHSFRPDDNIKRSEVAAIVTRMMDEESRQSFSLGEAAQKIVKAYDYVGSWGDKWSGRAFMDILPGEYPKYSVTLRWSSSYNSAGVWSMTAVFNEETKRLEYADGEMAYVTYSEDGSVESTEIEWSDAEGWLAINENGGLDWNDSREERCSEMIFERYEYYPIEQSEI